jgi:hypothetical protein
MKHKSKLENFVNRMLGRLSEEELDETEKMQWELCPYFKDCRCEVLRVCFGTYENCQHYKHKLKYKMG